MKVHVVQEDSAGISSAGSMVTLKAFCSLQRPVRDRLNVCITYASDNLEQEQLVIVHTDRLRSDRAIPGVRAGTDSVQAGPH